MQALMILLAVILLCGLSACNKADAGGGTMKSGVAGGDKACST